MNVNYEYYRLFYYVCKYHSITRAANVLRMSQPNVTRALNRLEEQLGCKLLVRSTRGVTMTPEGEVLFAHVEIAQEQLQAGKSELAGITAPAAARAGGSLCDHHPGPVGIHDAPYPADAVPGNSDCRQGL